MHYLYAVHTHCALHALLAHSALPVHSVLYALTLLGIAVIAWKKALLALLVHNALHTPSALHALLAHSELPELLAHSAQHAMHAHSECLYTVECIHTEG